MDFTGAGSGLADQVVLRNHTLYLEGLHIHFGQVPALQPSTDCKTQLLTGTAQWGGLQGGEEVSQSSYIPILASV